MALQPQTSKNSELPNVTCVIRKLQLLRIEFETECCSLAGAITWIEIQRDYVILSIA